MKATGPGHTLDDAIARGERPPAPAVALPELDGGSTAALADYRGQGRRPQLLGLVVHALPAGVAAARALAPADLRPGRDRARRRQPRRDGATRARSSSRFRLTYPMLRDRDGDTQKRFGVTGYPETLVVDRRRADRRAAARPRRRRLPAPHVLPLLSGSA